MIMNKIAATLFISLGFALTAQAQVAQIKTPNALVVVIRPLDMWSPNSSYQEDTLDAVKDKKASFFYYDASGKEFAAYETIFQGVSKHPVTQAVATTIKAKGFRFGAGSVANNLFYSRQPMTLQVEDMPNFIAAQNAVFAQSVIDAGNPKKLATKEGIKKFAGFVAAAATFVIVGDKLGYDVANYAVVGSGHATNIAEAVQNFGRVLIPRPVPDIDFSGYKKIEARRIDTHGRDQVGMVIVAYNEPKTEATENEAMTAALISLTGADTTADAVSKARSADLAKRQSIWDDCVARGKCNE